MLKKLFPRSKDEQNQRIVDRINRYKNLDIWQVKPGKFITKGDKIKLQNDLIESLQRKILEGGTVLNLEGVDKLTVAVPVALFTDSEVVLLDRSFIDRSLDCVAAHLIRSGNVINSLTHLNLAHSRLNGQDARFLAEALKDKNNSLISLNIKGNGISNEAIGKIVDSLRININLIDFKCDTPHRQDEIVQYINRNQFCKSFVDSNKADYNPRNLKKLLHFAVKTKYSLNNEIDKDSLSQAMANMLKSKSCQELEEMITKLSIELNLEFKHVKNIILIARKQDQAIKDHNTNFGHESSLDRPSTSAAKSAVSRLLGQSRQLR